jgi:hypothetical protein
MKSLLVGLMILVAAGAGWQWYDNLQLQQAIENRAHVLTEVRQQYEQMQRELTWWHQHQRDYQLLVNNGFIGKDARAVWYRQLSSLASIAGVKHTEFDIAAQVPSQPEQRSANRILMETPVHWRGEVAHEGVLSDVLQTLAADKHGIFSVRSCDLSHPQDDAPITVDCVFVWQVLVLS